MKLPPTVPYVAKLARLEPEQLGYRLLQGLAQLVCTHKLTEKDAPCARCKMLVQPIAKPLARAIIEAASAERMNAGEVSIAAGRGVTLFLREAEKAKGP